MSKKTTQKEKVQFLKSDINLNPARLKGESFDNYKNRRKEGNEAAKNAVKGQLIWLACKLDPIYSGIGDIIVGYKRVLVKGTYNAGIKEEKRKQRKRK